MRQIKDLLKNSISPATKRTYARTWDKWLNFHSALNIKASRKTLYPTIARATNVTLPKYTPETAALFVAQLAQQYAPATIKAQMSAISYYYRIYKEKDPFATHLIRRMLESLKKSEPKKAKRAPLTRTLLENLLQAVKGYTSSKYERALLRAIMTMLYTCCMRCGEAVKGRTPRHAVQKQHLTPIETNAGPGYKLRFKSYKFSKEHTDVIIIPSFQKYCPVTEIKRYLKLRVGSETGQLFTNSNGSPVTTVQFAKHLHSLVQRIGLDPKRYKPHSFRIGRASDLANNNHTSDTLKRTGRWRSYAYKTYIRQAQFELPP